MNYVDYNTIPNIFIFPGGIQENPQNLFKTDVSI